MTKKCLLIHIAWWLHVWVQKVINEIQNTDTIPTWIKWFSFFLSLILSFFFFLFFILSFFRSFFFLLLIIYVFILAFLFVITSICLFVFLLFCLSVFVPLFCLFFSQNTLKLANYVWRKPDKGNLIFLLAILAEVEGENKTWNQGQL